MSRKTVSAVIGSFLVAGLALGAVQGCGSSGSSSTPSCSEICVKGAMCQADASTATATTLCNTVCAQGAAGASGQGTKCTNANAMASAFNNCFSMTDCTAFNTCVNNVPKCQTGAGGANGAAGESGTGTGGTTGTGGATGTGGTSGAAGSSGAASCATCDKAQTCCLALVALAGQPTSTCTYSAANCIAAGTAQASDITVCQEILSGGAAVSASCR